MIRSLVVTAALVLAGTPCLAQERPPAPDEYEDHLGLGIPMVKVTGSLGTEVWVDDNILLSGRDEESDVITVLVPQMRLRVGDEKGHLWIDYRGRDRHFNENARFDGMEHFLDSSFYLGMGEFRFDAWTSYQDRNDPFSLPGETKRIDWLQAEGGGTLGWKLDPIEVELSGEMRRFEIMDASFDRFDHRRTLGSLLVAAGMMGKIQAQALAEAGLARTNYDREDVLDSFDLTWIAGGLRGSLADNLQLTVKIGGFRVASMESFGAVESASATGFYFLSAATWQPLEGGELLLQVQRRPVESIYTSWMVVERYEVAYTHQLLGHVTIGVGGFIENDFESKGGEDRKGFGANASLSYAVSGHLSLSMAGELRYKRSDSDTFDYDDARGNLGATVSW